MTAVVILLFLFSNICLGGGAWLTEAGGMDMAMAGAGSAALAADASTLAANPAGMVSLSGTQLLVAALPIKLDATLSGTGAIPGSINNRGGAVPAGAIFATHSDGRWAAGLGTYSYFGLGFDYGKQWSGARALRSAEILSLNIAPALAYRLTDKLSLGAALQVQYAAVEAKLASANDAAFYGPPVNMSDGHLKLAGDSWAPGGVLGASYVHSHDTRFGLAWTAPVSHDMTLDLQTRNVHPVAEVLLQQAGDVALDISLPQQWRLSGVHHLSTDTLLTGSLAWQQWSAFGDAELAIGRQHAPMFEGDLRDTWGVAVGLRHRLRPQWTVAGGVGYDSNPAKNGRAPIYFPVSEQVRLALGADYQYSPALIIRAALSVVCQDNVRIGQDSYPLQLPGMPVVTGDIKGSRIYVGVVAMDYRW